jgi:hypothetical protein
LVGTLSFNENICQSAALLWFGLRDIGIFLEHGFAEKMVVRAHAYLDPNKWEVGFIFA